MKLDRETIAWIEKAIGDMRHGEVRLILCEGIIGKIITEEHRLLEKAAEKGVKTKVGGEHEAM